MQTASTTFGFPTRWHIRAIEEATRSLVADARQDAIRAGVDADNEKAVFAEVAAILRRQRQELRTAESRLDRRAMQAAAEAIIQRGRREARQNRLQRP